MKTTSGKTKLDSVVHVKTKKDLKALIDEIKKNRPDSEVVLRLSAFILDRKTDDIRDEFFEYLLLLTLSSFPQKATNVMINDKIQEILNLDNFPQNLVDEMLQKSIKSDFVNVFQEDDGEKFLLTPAKKQYIEQMEKNIQKQREDVLSELIRKVEARQRKKVKTKIKNLICSTFHDFLGLLFHIYGVECCQQCIKQSDFSSGLIEHFQAKEILDIFLTNQIKDVKLKRNVKITMEEMFKSPNLELSKFLYGLAQSYYLFQILKLDPECHLLIKSALKDITLYLDTNSLIYLVTGHSSKYESYKDLFRLVSSLGIKLLVSERTNMEYRTKLEKERKSLLKIGGKIPCEHINKISNIANFEFLHHYCDLVNKKEFPTLNMEMYIEMIRDYHELLSQTGIIIDKDEKKYKFDEDLFEKAKLKVSSANLSKKPPVVEHDAYHFCLIQELRKESSMDIFGPKFWFLTYDSTLVNAEKYLPYSEQGELPSSIHGDILLQMLTPLLTPSFLEKEGWQLFGKLFGSNFISLGPKVPSNVFPMIQQLLNNNNIPPQTFKKMIGRDYVQRFFLDVDDIEPDKQEKKFEGLMKKALREVNNKQDLENQELSLENKQLRYILFLTTLSFVFIISNLLLLMFVAITKGNLGNYLAIIGLELVTLGIIIGGLCTLYKDEIREKINTLLGKKNKL